MSIVNRISKVDCFRKHFVNPIILQSSLSVSCFNMEDYQNLKYTELQKLAKAAGIKAKGSKAELVNALVAFNNGNEAEGEHEDETKKKPKDTKNKSTKKGKKPVADVEASPNFPFLLITSTGPAADHMCDTFGLYRKTEEMKEGRHVFKQEHDSKEDENGDDEYELFSDKKGVWKLSLNGTNSDEYLKLKATTPRELPTSVKWQYRYEGDDYDWKHRYEYEDDENSSWHNDPALTVTGFSEKPICECEVIISLSQEIERDIKDPGVAGVYRANGSYHGGRPVLKHSGGRFTLSVDVDEGSWVVDSFYGDGDGGGQYLWSGSAPSQCPADPRAAIMNTPQGMVKKGQNLWGYADNSRGSSESEGISVKCNTCINK